jgi:predicted ATP-dependent Lon-type protease
VNDYESDYDNLGCLDILNVTAEGDFHWDTPELMTFSYIDKETQEEIFVCLPEERDSDLIESIPLPPGVFYTTVVDGWFNT